MGETTNQPFQLSFNAALKVEFQGSRVTSDGGLILVRELDERLGFSDLIAQHITDPRGKNMQFPLIDLVRQSVYRRLAVPRRIDTWSLTSLQQRLMKTGGRLVKHALYYGGVHASKWNLH